MNDCNVELQDPFYHSDLFMMFCFKILPCKKTYRHDWRVCPFAHGDETAKRRDPRLCKYTGVICPDAKKGRSCPRGEDCPCTHSLFEYWLHPTRFKTEICSRGSRCNRPFCFFAHKQSEIRKPNFRLQMQGVTCETPIKTNSIPSMNPPTFNRPQGFNNASESSNFGSNYNLNRPSALFDASSMFQSAIPRVSLEEGGGGASAQDSGSSCDLELPCATWNSLIGGPPQGDAFFTSLESPRLDSGTHKVKRNGVPALSMPLCPILPQIPSMERNSVDWYSIPPTTDATFQLSSARGTSSTRMSENRRFGGKKSGRMAPGGISPRLLEMNPMMNRSFKEESLISNFNRQDSTNHSGYDRHFLLATIQDVYQSMVSGGNNLPPLESNDHPIPASPLDSDFNLIGNEGTSSLLQSMSFGLGSTQGFTSMTGSGGNTCGIEGLQHDRCLSSSSFGSISGAQRSNIERMISTLLQTDSDPMTRYFN